MAAENETVISSTKLSLNPQPPLLPMVLTLQIVLLAALLTCHVAIPFLLRVAGDNQLLLDSFLAAQFSLLLITVALGGVSWNGLAFVAGGVCFALVGWANAYPQHMLQYAISYIVLPPVVLAGTLFAVRWLGYRGVWGTPEGKLPAELRPFQVSIRLLMGITLAVAVLLAAASWLRKLEQTLEITWPRALLGIAVFGSSDALLSLIAVWSIGCRGSGLIKFAVLLCAAVFVAVFQIYAYRMEEYWHYAALMSAGWVLITCGTLFIWRLCGWRMTSIYEIPAKMPG